MSTVIEDGRGSGNKARVTIGNRLDVSSRMQKRIFYVSKNDEKAFSTNLRLTQVSGGVAEGLGYFTYAGTGGLYIEKVVLSTEESDPNMTKFGLWVDPTTLSGGIARIPTNLNRGSTLMAETTCIENGDGTVLTISGGESLYTIRLKGPMSYEVVLDSALILQRGNTFAIKASAVTSGTKIRATVMFFEEED